VAHRLSSTLGVACFAVALYLLCVTVAVASDAQRCFGRTPTDSDPCGNYTADCLPDHICEKNESGGLCHCVGDIG